MPRQKSDDRAPVRAAPRAGGRVSPELRWWDGAAYGRTVNPADLQGLRSGDLGTREEHLQQLLDRVRAHGDESAISALHVLVRDYRDFHRSLYTRAMNQAALFADAGLQESLLAALGDTQYLSLIHI